MQVERAVQVRVLEYLAEHNGRQGILMASREFGVPVPEVAEFARRYGYPNPLMLARGAKVLASQAETPPTPEAKPGKRCTKCGETKPRDQFYAASGAADGLSSHCSACNNARPITPTRLVRNRAMHRATAVLIDRHRAEWEEIKAQCLIEAQAEHDRLVAEAAQRGHPDAPVARLKPGPRRAVRPETTEAAPAAPPVRRETVVERLDVARCPHCHRYHDAGHECDHCGDTPGGVHPTKAPRVREWARANGIPVSERGRIQQTVLDAYAEAHPQEGSA